VNSHTPIATDKHELPIRRIEHAVSDIDVGLGNLAGEVGRRAVWVRPASTRLKVLKLKAPLRLVGRIEPLLGRGGSTAVEVRLGLADVAAVGLGCLVIRRCLC
jgi:hypothetical protein